MENVLVGERRKEESVQTLITILEIVGLVILAVTIWFAIYHDDIQFNTRGRDIVLPTIYSIRVIGIKLIDLSTAIVFAITIFLVFLRRGEDTSPFHREILIILSVYFAAGIIGFVYGFVFDYSWERWYQDFQMTLYLVIYFFVSYHLIPTWKRWVFLFIVVLGAMAFKNIIIFTRLFTGVGTIIGSYGMRTTQRSDGALLPLMLCVGILLLLRKEENIFLRLFILGSMVLYVFNSFISFERTGWVILLVVLIYILSQSETAIKYRMLILAAGLLAAASFVVTVFFPRFFLLFVWKFGTIFSWGIHGDRSNATRLIEVVDIVHRLLAHFALLQGMGLGAWWGDSFVHLLPDEGSGFIGETRNVFAHVWVIEQLLKIGLIGVVIYWRSMYRMFMESRRIFKRLPAGSRERALLLGLNAGFLAIMAASTDFSKVFLVVGVVLALIARFGFLLDQGNAGSVKEENLQSM